MQRRSEIDESPFSLAAAVPQSLTDYLDTKADGEWVEIVLRSARCGSDFGGDSNFVYRVAMPASEAQLAIETMKVAGGITHHDVDRDVLVFLPWPPAIVEIYPYEAS